MSSTEHDLAAFIRQDLDELASEYQRIRRRASEDPGTAGDESEEGWADLLRQWLPQTYEVVTKGRILSVTGEASPQIDVLVLSPGYPARLKTKKVYMSAGVVAAFECRLTLSRGNLVSAIERCREFRAVYKAQGQTPRESLLGPLFYGVLAHDHSWSRESALGHIDTILEDHTDELHPLNIPDVVCVGSLATWRKLVVIDVDRLVDPHDRTVVGGTMMKDATDSSQLGASNQAHGPLANLIAALLKHLAQRDESQRALYRYISLATRTSNHGHAPLGRNYSRAVLPPLVIREMLARGSSQRGGYEEFDEWSIIHQR